MMMAHRHHSYSKPCYRFFAQRNHKRSLLSLSSWSCKTQKHHNHNQTNALTPKKTNSIGRHPSAASSLALHTTTTNVTTAHQSSHCFNLRQEFSSSSSASSIFETRPEWHDRNFMNGFTVEEKESWLSEKLHNVGSSINSKDDESSSSSKLDPEAFLLVLRALAECKDGQGGVPQRAEAWLSKMMKAFNDNDSEKELSSFITTECYSCVLTCWARSKEDAGLAALRAERWIHKAHEDAAIAAAAAKEGTTGVEVNTQLYNSYLDVLSKGNGTNQLRVDHAHKAERVLKEMQYHASKNTGNNTNDTNDHSSSSSSRLAPNTESYNLVMRAWTRIKTRVDVADRVVELLHDMEQEESNNSTQANVAPNTLSYNMVIDALGIRASLKAKNQLFNKNQSTTKKENAGVDDMMEAEAILEYMLERRRDHVSKDPFTEPTVSPDTITYNCLISGWKRLAGYTNHDAPALEAERILRRLIQDEVVQPDPLSYTLVAGAWANSQHVTAGHRASFWLARLWDEYHAAIQHGSEHPPQPPTIEMYNTVIRAWSKAAGLGDRHAASTVDHLFLDLKKLNEDDGGGGDDDNSNKRFPGLLPNTDTYSLVVQTLLKTERSGIASTPGEAVFRASAIMEEAIEMEEQRPEDVACGPDLFVGILKTLAALTTTTTTRQLQYDPTVFLDLAESTFSKWKASRHPLEPAAYVWLLRIGCFVFSTYKDDNDSNKSNNDDDDIDDDDEEEDSWTAAMFTQQVVRDCCQEGLLSRDVVREVSGKNNNSNLISNLEESQRRSLVEELFPEWPLPLSWTRNVVVPGRDESSYMPRYHDARVPRSNKEPSSSQHRHNQEYYYRNGRSTSGNNLANNRQRGY